MGDDPAGAAMLNKFKEYELAKAKLQLATGISITNDVEVCDASSYWYSDGEVLWWDEGEEYGEEARLLKEFDDCEVFIVYACTGDRYIAVFNKANKEQ